MSNGCQTMIPAMIDMTPERLSFHAAFLQSKKKIPLGIVTVSFNDGKVTSHPVYKPCYVRRLGSQFYEHGAKENCPMTLRTAQ